MGNLLQARQLFLAEALELCQQVKEGLLILAHAPTVLTHQKLVRRLQTLKQGTEQLELTDLQLLAQGLTLLLERLDLSDPQPRRHELLDHFCDGLQLSLITHRSMTDGAPIESQRAFVLESLIPKVLEGIDAVLDESLEQDLQIRLLRQQTKWLQLWSQALKLPELSAISQVMLTNFEAFPAAAQAIAQVGLAGLLVAYGATVQQPTAGFAEPEPAADFQPPLSPAEQALEVFKTAHCFVGITHQTVFCLATQTIAEILILEPSLVSQAGGQIQVLWREHALTLYQLNSRRGQLSIVSQTIPANESVLLILHQDGDHLAIALEIDRLISESELKLRPVANAQSEQPYCYGTTKIQGKDLQVIDLNWLLRQSLHPANTELAQTAAEPPNRQQNPSFVTASEPSKAPKTVLIVDDSKTVREMLSLTLQEAGYQILQAEDGQQALEQLQTQTIDLTICDLEMSNLSGFEFLRHRLQNPRLKQIPVIILSSHGEEEYRQLSQKLGAAQYFTIPYRSAELTEAIAVLLNRS